MNIDTKRNPKKPERMSEILDLVLSKLQEFGEISISG